MLELVIAMAIMTIILAISYPNYSSYMERYRLKCDAQQIYSLQQQAKMLAIKTHKNTQVFFNTSSEPQSVIIYSDKGPNDSWDNGGDDVVHTTYCFYPSNNYGHGDASKNATKTAGTYFDTDSITHSSNNIEFNPMGSVNPPSGYVYIQNRVNQSYAIGTLAPTGIIRISTWAETAWR